MLHVVIVCNYCDGFYKANKEKPFPCYKTHKDVKYWNYIPVLFDWPKEEDQVPCPLLDSYQLVRNILAACVNEKRELDPGNGHAVLLYDDRNPSFFPGGKGFITYQFVKGALKDPARLQKCTWQAVLGVINKDFDWLKKSLGTKYGLYPDQFKD